MYYLCARTLVLLKVEIKLKMTYSLTRILLLYLTFDHLTPVNMSPEGNSPSDYAARFCFISATRGSASFLLLLMASIKIRKPKHIEKRRLEEQGDINFDVIDTRLSSRVLKKGQARLVSYSLDEHVVVSPCVQCISFIRSLR